MVRKAMVAALLSAAVLVSAAAANAKAKVHTCADSNRVVRALHEYKTTCKTARGVAAAAVANNPKVDGFTCTYRPVGAGTDVKCLKTGGKWVNFLVI